MGNSFLVGGWVVSKFGGALSCRVFLLYSWEWACWVDGLVVTFVQVGYVRVNSGCYVEGACVWISHCKTVVTCAISTTVVESR